MPRSLVRLLVLCVAGFLVVTGCGNDDDGDTAETTTTAAVDGGGDDTGATTTTAGPIASADDIAAVRSIDDFCTLMEVLGDDDNPVFGTTDPFLSGGEALQGALDYAGAAVARAAELAGDPARSDFELLAGGLAELDEVFAAYDYDITAVISAGDDPEVASRLESLETEEYQTAVVDIEEYVLAECGIALN